MGVVVLRLDVSGLGDSPLLPGEKENVVYTEARTTDIADAVAHLRREWGAQKVHVVGLCSGAYHSFKAAARGIDAESITLVNQQTYDYKPGDPIDVTKTVAEAQRLRKSALKASSWKKLLSGEVKVRAASRVITKRLADVVVGRSRRLAVRLGIPLRAGLPAELVSITKKKTFVRIVWSDGEQGEPLLAELAGSLVDTLRRRGALSIEHMRSCDHTFTAVWMQRAITEQLEAWLDLPRHRPTIPRAAAG